MRILAIRSIILRSLFAASLTAFICGCKECPPPPDQNADASTEKAVRASTIQNPTQPVPGTMDDQLKQLMDYTKFHIGLYATLITLLITFISLDKRKIPCLRVCLLLTAVCFTVAGVCGGLVGSSIPYHTNFEHFRKACIGPWGWNVFHAETCIHLEHSSFWVGIAIALIGLATARSPSDRQSRLIITP